MSHEDVFLLVYLLIEAFMVYLCRLPYLAIPHNINSLGHKSNID